MIYHLDNKLQLRQHILLGDSRAHGAGKGVKDISVSSTSHRIKREQLLKKKVTRIE
jgi:hypothetical protein